MMEDFNLFNKVNQEPNFYKILGCDPSSTNEQISTEYKIKALKLHPDKNLNNNHSQNEFKNLQEAKETLLDPVLRKKYDLWLDGNFAMTWYEWRRFTENNTPVFHWVNKKSEPMIKSTDLKKSTFDEKSDQLSNFRLSSEKNDAFLTKFRNYQI